MDTETVRYARPTTLRAVKPIITKDITRAARLVCVCVCEFPCTCVCVCVSRFRTYVSKTKRVFVELTNIIVSLEAGQDPGVTGARATRHTSRSWLTVKFRHDRTAVRTNPADPFRPPPPSSLKSPDLSPGSGTGACPEEVRAFSGHRCKTFLLRFCRLVGGESRQVPVSTVRHIVFWLCFLRWSETSTKSDFIQ